MDQSVGLDIYNKTGSERGERKFNAVGYGSSIRNLVIIGRRQQYGSWRLTERCAGILSQVTLER